MKLRLPFLSLGLIALALSSSAQAALGGPASTLQDDRMQLKATAPVANNKLNFTVHEMATADGTTVREYISGGNVFGVAWRGPHIPNLKQLMGSYYETYTSELAARRKGHAPVAIRRTDFVAHSGGHMRAFSGSAFVPNMLPAGVTEADIQ